MSTRGTCGRVRSGSADGVVDVLARLMKGGGLAKSSDDMDREGCVWESTCPSGNAARARRGPLDSQSLVTEPQGWDAQTGGEKG